LSMAARENVLSKLNTPARFGLGTILTAITAAIYFFVFHTDVANEIDVEHSRATRLKKDLDDAKAAEHAYQKDLAELTELQQREGELAKVLPPTTESAGFLSAIQNVANVVGVNLRAWTPQAEQPQKFYAKVPMKLELSGRYHQIAKFFYNVGQLDRIINMEDISLLEPTLKNDELVIKTDVLATAFRALAASEKSAANKVAKGKEGTGQ
jgi:type IV pilus assembly protein PilO